MSRPDPLDDARLLIRKAAEDEAAVRALIGSAEVADTVIGFHAQQAVEKLIKAVLAEKRVRYPFTHDIALLVDLARRASVEVDFPTEEAIDLTGWGAVFRYSDELDESLDRVATADLVESVRRWAERSLD